MHRPVALIATSALSYKGAKPVWENADCDWRFVPDLPRRRRVERPGAAFAAAVSRSHPMNAKSSGSFQLPALPWDEGALDPVISARTVAFHYGKHHLTYVQKLNELVAGTRYVDMPLEQVVELTYTNPAERKIFNNAAQAWNHTFFWRCLRPRAGGKPSGELARRIEGDLGGFEKFREQFIKEAVDCFGSGWAWLAEKDGKLQVMATPNAENPLVHGAKPILTVDVWEHAYYLDYQNKRQEFVTAVVDKLLDWRYAEEQLEGGVKPRKAA